MQLTQDLRFALRTLWRARTFTVVTVATLGLAIGLNTTIFSMVSLLLVGDLPIGDPDHTAFVRTEQPSRGVTRGDLTRADYQALREAVAADEVRSFARVAGLSFDTRVLAVDGGEPRRVPVGLLAPDFFPTWQLGAVHGRVFEPAEGAPGGERVALIAHGLWQREYAGDPEILGRTIEIDGYQTTVVGVMDPALEFGDIARFEYWMPLVIDPARADSVQRDIFVTAALADGATFEQAQDELSALGARLEEQFPDSHRGWILRVKPAREDLADDAFMTIMVLLSITVFGVLLVACSNVATLTLARSAERARELAVRAALGAGRLRILGQLLTESLLLSLAAAVLGLGVAAVAHRGMVWLAGDRSGITYILRTMSLDHRVLLFTLGLAVLAPLLFGLLPALQAARRDLRKALHEGSSRSGGSRGALRGRRWLVGAQVAVALSLMLLVGTLVHSLRQQRRVDLGYDAASILSARIDLPPARYADDETRRAFARRSLAELQASPGVHRAAFTSRLPIEGPGAATSFRIDGRAAATDEELPWATPSVVSPGFTSLLGLSVQRGRDLQAADDESGRAVALVNREAARLWWPDGDAVGARLELSDRPGVTVEVVGIVGDLHRPSLLRPVEPEIYLPLAQWPQADLAVLVRGQVADAAQLAPALRSAVAAVDPALPVAEVRTVQGLFEDAWATSLTIESLLSSFAFFALLMAAAGIYGVASYAVARRRREMGIRMALGARRSEIGGLVLRQTAGILAGGALFGALGGWGLQAFLAAGLGGIAEVDPPAWLGVAALLVAVALLATALPARRAARVDPATALRDE